MRLIDIKNSFNLNPKKLEIRGKTTIVDTDDGKYVLKKSINTKVLDYLKTRGFNYYPKVIYQDNYNLIEYVDDQVLPPEQKIIDMIDLVALLHFKTSYYKEIENDDYKKIYEDISNNILYLKTYYDELATIIETKIFMSPAEYLLIRNISELYQAINYAANELEQWYKLVENKNKIRQVVLHNNLKLDHFMKNEKSYLISWDKSRIDIPIFDLYKLYRRHGNALDFTEILKRYEKTYPLLEDERKLLFVLIALPEKIEFTNNVYEDTLRITKEIDILFKTEYLLLPYYSKDTHN